MAKVVSDEVLLDNALVELLSSFKFPLFAQFASTVGKDYSKFKVSSLKEKVAIRDIYNLCMLESFVTMGLSESDLTRSGFYNRSYYCDKNAFVRVQDLYKFITLDKGALNKEYDLDFLTLLSGALDRFGIIKKLVDILGQKQTVGLNTDVLIAKALFDMYSAMHEQCKSYPKELSSPRLNIFYPALIKLNRAQDYLLFNECTSSLAFAELGKHKDLDGLYTALSKQIIASIAPNHKVTSVFIVTVPRRLFSVDYNDDESYEFICDAATGIPLAYDVSTTTPRNRTEIKVFVWNHLRRVLEQYPDIQNVIIDGQLISNALIENINSEGLNLICRMQKNSPLHLDLVHVDTKYFQPVKDKQDKEVAYGFHSTYRRTLPTKNKSWFNYDHYYDDEDEDSALDLSVLADKTLVVQYCDKILDKARAETIVYQQYISKYNSHESEGYAYRHLKDLLRQLKYCQAMAKDGGDPKIYQNEHGSWSLDIQFAINDDEIKRLSISETAFVVAQSKLDNPLTLEALYPLMLNFDKFQKRWHDLASTKLKLPAYYSNCEGATKGFVFLSNVLLMTLIALGHHIEINTDTKITLRNFKNDGFAVSPYVTTLAAMACCLSSVKVALKLAVIEQREAEDDDLLSDIADDDLQLNYIYDEAKDTLKKLGPEWSRFAKGHILRNRNYLEALREKSPLELKFEKLVKDQAKALKAPVHSEGSFETDSICAAILTALQNVNNTSHISKKNKHRTTISEMDELLNTLNSYELASESKA